MKRICIERFSELIDELRDKTIIVEGKRDAAALRRFGIKDIVALNGKSPLEVANMKIYKGKKQKEIVILTDFDRQGRKLASKLRNLLQRYKKRVNSRLRRKAMKFGKGKVEEWKNIDLARVYKRGDFHVKISSIFNKIHNKGEDKCERCYRKARCDWSHIWANRRFAGF